VQWHFHWIVLRNTIPAPNVVVHHAAAAAGTVEYFVSYSAVEDYL
jgi:hypothetical protein